jgi:hypothetical protein
MHKVRLPLLVKLRTSIDTKHKKEVTQLQNKHFLWTKMSPKRSHPKLCKYKNPNHYGSSKIYQNKSTKQRLLKFSFIKRQNLNQEIFKVDLKLAVVWGKREKMGPHTYSEVQLKPKLDKRYKTMNTVCHTLRWQKHIRCTVTRKTLTSKHPI